MSKLLKGWEQADKEAKKLDEEQKSSKNRLWNFWLMPDEEADILFTVEPVGLYMHNTQRKGRWIKVICSEEKCPFCAAGQRPQFYLIEPVVDLRGTWVDGAYDGKPVLKVWYMGRKLQAQAKRKRQKEKGINGYVFTIVRTGSGVDTTYTIETKKEIGAKEKKIRKELLKDFDMDKLIKTIPESAGISLETVDEESLPEEEEIPF